MQRSPFVEMIVESTGCFNSKKMIIWV